MFVKVSSPQQGQNIGSCKDLANYLDKEESTEFFSTYGENIPTNDVIKEIDKNGSGGLKKKEDKFYMLSINPSQRELQHLIGRKISNPAELTPSERQKLENHLKDYTHEVMSIYAKNFERENIKDNKDLVYFARIEVNRTHRHYDKEVENGIKRCGELKDGLNFHVHVIVSRKAKDRKTLLSPNVKSRGNKWKLNGQETKRGFNHEKFKTKSIECFNEKYNYKPNYKDTYNKSNSNALSVASPLVSKVKHTISKNIDITKGQLETEQKLLQKGAKIATTAIRAVKNPVGTAKTEILNFIKGLGKDMNKK